MNPDALFHYTTMTLATAGQLALERNRDDAELQDIEDASHMVWRWNTNRIALGLRPWI